MSIAELKDALRALDEAESVEREIGCGSWALPIARLAVIEAARRVAEQAGEPSADALAEALGKLSAEWRALVEQTKPSYEVVRTVDYLANELDVLIAKHKENTDGR